MSVLLVLPGAFLIALAFLGSVSGQTLGAAALLALASAAWAVRVGREPARGFAFSRAHLRPWARTVAGLPGKVARTGVALGRVVIAGGSPGRALTTPFCAGAADDPADRARRATAVLAASLAPDSFVVRANRGTTAHIHVITRDPPPSDPDWLA